MRSKPKGEAYAEVELGKKANSKSNSATINTRIE